MPVPQLQPPDLSYSTDGTVSWRHEHDLLLITIYEPRTLPRSRRRSLILEIWAALFLLICFLASNLSPCPDAIRMAIFVAAVLVSGHIVIRLLDRLSVRRHLLIRVNAHKLLVDECRPFNPTGYQSNKFVTLTGRAWTADEIASVTAKGSSFRIRTRTRRLAPLFITRSYAPADLAFAAAAIRTVLSDGVDAWTQSQHPSDGPPKSPLPEPPKNP